MQVGGEGETHVWACAAAESEGVGRGGQGVRFGVALHPGDGEALQPGGGVVAVVREVRGVVFSGLEIGIVEGVVGAEVFEQRGDEFGVVRFSVCAAVAVDLVGEAAGDADDFALHGGGGAGGGDEAVPEVGVLGVGVAFDRHDGGDAVVHDAGGGGFDAEEAAEGPGGGRGFFDAVGVEAGAVELEPLGGLLHDGSKLRADGVAGGEQGFGDGEGAGEVGVAGALQHEGEGGEAAAVLGAGICAGVQEGLNALKVFAFGGGMQRGLAAVVGAVDVGTQVNEVLCGEAVMEAGEGGLVQRGFAVAVGGVEVGAAGEGPGGEFGGAAAVGEQGGADTLRAGFGVAGFEGGVEGGGVAGGFGGFEQGVEVFGEGFAEAFAGHGVSPAGQV